MVTNQKNYAQQHLPKRRGFEFQRQFSASKSAFRPIGVFTADTTIKKNFTVKPRCINAL